MMSEWTSGDVASKAEWSQGSTLDGVSYHKVWRQSQQKFNEIKDRAEWGNVVSILVLLTCITMLTFIVLCH
jgi:hypothetical protein